MQQIQQKIELFHSLSLMCMILFLVCLGLCIFFFFLNDMYRRWWIQRSWHETVIPKKVLTFNSVDASILITQRR